MQNRTEALWAVHEIRQLAYRYAYAVDTRDWTLLESLWVETDVPVALPSLDIHSARTVSRRLAGIGASTLFIGNHLIDLDGPDRARGSVYCMGYVDAGVNTSYVGDSGFLQQAVIYRDSYERRDGRWLFRTRDHHVWWGVTWSENPMCQPPANWPKSQVGSGTAADVIRSR